MNVPLSVLDLAPISAGSDARTALRNTVDLAQHAERWGFRRYWVAEHHSVAVASSSPAVLIGQLASATRRIRIGSGAVQLSDTTALAVVESFATLDAFHPGRIDLGVGRSGHRAREAAAKSDATNSHGQWREIDGVVLPPPFGGGARIRNPAPKPRTPVQNNPEPSPPDFGDQMADILAMLESPYAADTARTLSASGRRTTLSPWVFGSSRGQSALVAGVHGLPFVASYHLTPGTALDAIDAYRDAFRPSTTLTQPYVVVSADIVVADDAATARHLASTYGHWVYSIRAGDGAVPYPDPDSTEPLTDEQFAIVKDRTVTQIVGDADDVAHRLEALQRLTAADELVVTSVTHRHLDRLRSHELIAKRWGMA